MNYKQKVRTRWLLLTTMFLLFSGVLVTSLSAQVAIIGTGTQTNTTTGAAPINIYFRSIRTQTVYTAAELNAAGMIGPSNITDLGYYIESPPLYDLPNFRIRMLHTTATDGSAHIDGDFQQVYQVASYMPVPGNWEVLTFAAPFEWNGVDNILIDTTFDQVEPTWNSSGQQRIFDSPNGMRFVRADGSPQGDNPTTTIVQYKPQVQLHYVPTETFDNDMAAFAITGPPNLSPGTQGTFTVSVRNMGENDQDIYTIRLMRDGDIELDSVIGTELLEQFDIATFDLNWTPTPADEGVVTVWGEVLLAGDENPDNNTTPTREVLVAETMSGTYVINQDGTGDFTSVGQAVTSLVLVGVDAPVVFEIAAGTYEEQIVITDIMGASATNTISFIGMGDDPEDTIITYEQTDTNNRHIVKLDGAKHVSFDNLKFEVGENATHGWVFHITNASENIEITNCHLYTNAGVTSTFYAGIIVSGSPTGATTLGNNVDTILIENNTIVGGYYGMTLIGASATPLQNATVINNTLQDVYFHGIYLNQTNEPFVSHNHIAMRSEGTTATGGSGIYNMNAQGALEFSYNTIVSPGQYGIYLSSSNAPDQRSMIYNNMIGGGFRNTLTTASGIYITTSSNIGIYYNSINMDGTTGRAIYSLASASGLFVLNNSFAFSGSGAGYAAYHANADNLSAHDHNNYYSGNSPNFVYYGSAVNNLAELQAVNFPPGNDSESRVGNPLYVSHLDLHAQGSQLWAGGTPIDGIDDDIDGDPRDPQNPCIGADEFVPLENDLAAINISGLNLLTEDITYTFDIAVQNAGTGNINNYTVKLMMVPDIELATVNVTDLLEATEINVVSLNWTPTTEGEYQLFGEVVLAGDMNPDNNTTAPMNVTVFSAGTYVVQVGNDTTSANTLPLNFNWRNSISQTIYMASELNVGGLITSIAYHNNFVTNLTNMPVRIWMANTQLTDLSAGWVSSNEMTSVFDGTVDFPSGQNTVLINLQTPFAYDGTSNILILANRPMDTQYYSASDHFYYTATTEYPNRSRNAQSDTVDYDPANITVVGTQTNRVPNTTFFLSVSGYGSLEGHVYNQANNDPISGATVQILDTDYVTTTNAVGFYSFPFVPEGLYDVEADAFGFHPVIQENVNITDGETTTTNFHLTQLSNVTVSGQVVGSDLPAIGIEGAFVTLTGYENYDTVTGTNGMFSIPGVYINQTYTITIIAEGYSIYTAEVVVEDVDLDMGVVIVDEVAYPPNTVIATQSADDTYVDLIWNSPLAIDYYFNDFETDDGGWIPTATWDPVGDWEWTNTYDVNNWYNSDSASATPPPTAYSGTGFWGTVINTNHTNSGGFSYLSQTFDFTAYSDARLSFWSWNDSFGSWDYGQIRVNGNLVWGPAWDYVGTVWEEVIIDLSAYDGLSEVEIVFEHYATTVVAYAGWYIDDVYIGPEASLPSRAGDRVVMDSHSLSERESLIRQTRLTSDTIRNERSRVLEGYQIYRFLYDDLNNPANWINIGAAADTTYTDLTWDNVASGFYRYAVRAEYTNDVLSEAAISNWVGKDMTTNVTVNITIDVGDSADGATVTLYYQDQDPDGNSPVYTATAVGDDPSVATLLNVLQGVYNLEVSKPGYSTYTQNNINIQTPSTFDVVLEEIPYPPVNLVYTAGNNLVSLSWQPPVPTARDASDFDYEAVVGELRASGITDKEEISQIIDNLLEERETLSTGNQRRNRALLGYNVYRDNEQINTELVEVTSYNDTTVENNVTYVYYVTAVYTLSESVPSNSVTVVPGPNQLIVIGEDTTSAVTLPFNFYWRNSLSQTIYMADELNIAGVITQIQYFNTFTTNLLNMPVKIYIGTTTQTDLTAGWIPSTQMELVFDGNVDFPAGQNTIAIDLDEFFFYDGTQNLVVFAHRPMDTQYYSSLDQFYYSTTTHDNRSRNINSDTVNYDPANPPDGGTLTNRVPNTGIYIVTVGMGSLDGYVYDQNNQPMEGAMITVADTDFFQYSNAQGYYLFPFMFEGTHTVTASKFGYYDGVAENVIVEEYETTTVNFTLNPLPTVTVSGRVVGSDQPDVGLDNAFIILEGYNYYETNGDANGHFSIPGVYADHTYTMTVQRGGYSTLTQEVAVGDTDLDLGDVVVNELAFPPFDVMATLSDDNTEAYVEWVSPDEYDFVEFRYDDGVPTIAIGLPDGTNNSILGAVHRRSAILNSVSWYTGGTTPHAGVNVFIFGLNAQGNPNSNAVLYQAAGVPNNHQQWTIHELPEEIEAPNGFLIGLSVTGNLGIAADNGVGDPYHFQNNTHYYTSNYTTGTWATMESAGYTNNFLLRAQGFDLGPIRSSGELFSEGRPELMTTGLESVELLGLTGSSSNPTSKRTMTTNRNNRVLVGFIVYRLAAGQEQTPDLWAEIATIPATQTDCIDTGIPELLNGSYRYAVRSVYTNNVLSLPSFSNIIQYEENIPYIANLQAELVGNDVHLSWSWGNRSGLPGRVRTGAIDRDTGFNGTTSSSSLRDDHSQSAASRLFEGFKLTRNGPVIVEGLMDLFFIDEALPPGEYVYTVIGEFTNGSTNMLHRTVIVPTDVDDVSIEPLITRLIGNHPNPFNPDTTINYSIDSDLRVKIEIFNIRGQLIRTLVDENHQTGSYSVIWNGKDSRGRDAGSGIFFYRMTAGEYSSTKKMIMMK